MQLFGNKLHLDTRGKQSAGDDILQVIEKAKGILMKNNTISEDEAYKYLRSISMNKRKSIAEVAKIIVDTESMLH
jgi:AmiR/NasT family two-component response regulator